MKVIDADEFIGALKMAEEAVILETKKHKEDSPADIFNHAVSVALFIVIKAAERATIDKEI